MSKEVFQIVRAMNLKDIRNQLALQCAPLLTGIKISNLLIVHPSYKDEIIDIFKETRISYFVLYKCEDRIMILLYDKEKLQIYLKDKLVSELLYEKGYMSLDNEEVLREFSLRYERYKNDKQEFPHEMGLILGYPVDSVRGFIDNNGSNYLYSGYWKVYNNLEESINTFNQYNYAKELLIKLVSQGTSIRSILKYYQIKKISIAV